MTADRFTRRTKRSACWRSGPGSADQTGCTASGTGCGPAAGALEEPACWTRCGPAVAPPGCTSGTAPATQTPPTAGRCPPGRRKCPAAAATLPVNFPAACSSWVDAADRPALPTTTTTNCLRRHRWVCSWRGRAAVPPLRSLPTCYRHFPSCSGLPRRQLLRLRTRRRMTKACTRRTIPACGHCSGARTTTRTIRAGPKRSVCPPGDIRTRQTRSVPAWVRAECGSSSRMTTTPADTRSGP
uniref:(northern house mosquito) hypothetical protein n=1 Tax=Culex pipiens TaxID=7175 RepID=A0A8D8A963_CULPI